MNIFFGIVGIICIIIFSVQVNFYKEEMYKERCMKDRLNDCREYAYNILTHLFFETQADDFRIIDKYPVQCQIRDAIIALCHACPQVTKPEPTEKSDDCDDCPTGGA